MLNQLKLTIITATCLGGLYWLYALWVNPLTERPSLISQQQNSRVPVSAGTSPRENKRMAEKWLSQDAWTADAKYQFRTEEAFVYSNQWEQVDSNKAVRFQPFAMIWKPPGEDSDKRPITIVSDSAMVQFASKFDIQNPNPGRLIGGSLEKEVLIRGPNGLFVQARNVNFSEDALRIYSDHPVQFAYGKNRGRALGLQIELIPADDPPEQGTPSVAGIRSIRLRKDVDMNLILEEDDEPVPVRVTSKGGFEYVLETNLATFEDDVRVRRPTGPNQIDEIECDRRLMLMFEQKGGEGAGKTSSKDFSKEAGNVASTKGENSSDQEPFQGVGDDLTFRRLRAEGNSVVLVSQENHLAARMTQLIYDARSRLVALTDSRESVQVRHKNSELHSPEITLMHDEDGKIGSSWCRGAGRLKHRDPETGELVLSAEWLKQLRYYSDPQSKGNILELEKRAIVRQPKRKMGLAADSIKVWIDRIEEFSSSSGIEGTESEEEGMRPKRILAQNNVAMVSPQLQGETDRLEILFKEGRLPKMKTPRSLSRKSRETLTQAVGYQPEEKAKDSAGRVSLETLGEGDQLPNRSSQNTNSKSPSAYSKPAKKEEAPIRERPFYRSEEPLIVTSNRIRVHLLQAPASVELKADENRIEVSEVWTEGEVHLTQEHGRDEGTLHLSGDQLHLQNQGPESQLAHLSGEPAEVKDRDVHIEGNDIYLDRGENRAWVEGKGLLQLAVKNSLDGEELEGSQNLDIWWKEQMEFDGKTAHFLGKVRGILANSEMRCNQMDVELTKRIPFTGEELNQQEAEISRVVCKDGVEVNSYEYEAEELMEVRRANFWKFTLNQITGETEARGPGWIVFWRRGQGKRASLSPSSVAQANRPMQADSSKWEYTRVDFTGKSEGNIKDRYTTFRDQVSIVYGPVERPLQVIDPSESSRLPKDSGLMRCDTLQLTHHEETKERPGYIQLLAEGNAELEGRTFNALADSISYDESKELYKLSGLGNREATIFRQETVGGDYDRASAQSMKFAPSRNQLKLDGTTSLQGLQ